MSAPSESSVTIDCLPEEVLCTVFSFLESRHKASAARVCLAWRDAVYTRSLWQGVEARLNLDSISPSTFPSLNERGIQRVVVLRCQDHEALLRLISAMPHLASLNLGRCKNLTGDQLKKVFSLNMQDLKVLNLSSTEMNGDAIHSILENLQNLVTFTLQCDVDNKVFCAIGNNLKNLYHLTVSNPHYLYATPVSLREGMECLAQTQSLRELSFFGCPIEDDGIHHISKGLRHLCRLTLLGGYVTDYGFLSISQMCSLKELYLTSSQITNRGLMYLSTGVLRLNSLYLTKCPILTDEGMRFLARMSTLQVLTLFDCEIGDAGMEYLCRGKSGLTCLSLDRSPITDDGLEKLSKGLKSLRILRLENCHSFGEEGLLKVVENLSNLRSLIVTGLPHCTREKIQEAKPRLALVSY